VAYFFAGGDTLYILLHLRSNLTKKSLDPLVGFNTIYWWVGSEVDYFLDHPVETADSIEWDTQQCAVASPKNAHSHHSATQRTESITFNLASPNRRRVRPSLVILSLSQRTFVALIFQKKIIIQLNCKNAVSRAFREKLYSYRSKRPQLLITKTTLHNRHRLSDGVVDRALVGAFPSRRRVSLSLAQSAANKFTDWKPEMTYRYRRTSNARV